MAIVQVEDRFYLVSRETSGKIRDMAPDTFVHVPTPDRPDDDDPYADYQVPDDLMW
jgi:uncharacterized protein YaiL (DUF2058 family)